MPNTKGGARRMPVEDPIELRYVGPPTLMFQNAYRGPVTGNGYYAEPGQVIEVERLDAEEMALTPLWTDVGEPEVMEETE